MLCTGTKSSPLTLLLFSSHEGFLSYAIHLYIYLSLLQRNNLIKSTLYNETRKMAHDSQIVKAKEPR